SIPSSLQRANSMPASPHSYNPTVGPSGYYNQMPAPSQYPTSPYAIPQIPGAVHPPGQYESNPSTTQQHAIYRHSTISYDSNPYQSEYGNPAYNPDIRMSTYSTSSQDSNFGKQYPYYASTGFVGPTQVGQHHHPTE